MGCQCSTRFKGKEILVPQRKELPPTGSLRVQPRNGRCPPVADQPRSARCIWSFELCGSAQCRPLGLPHRPHDSAQKSAGAWHCRGRLSELPALGVRPFLGNSVVSTEAHRLGRGSNAPHWPKLSDTQTHQHWVPVCSHQYFLLPLEEHRRESGANTSATRERDLCVRGTLF